MYLWINDYNDKAMFRSIEYYHSCYMNVRNMVFPKKFNGPNYCKNISRVLIDFLYKHPP